jgi:hypothetical protein
MSTIKKWTYGSLFIIHCSLFLVACGQTELTDIANPGDYAIVYLRQAVESPLSCTLPVADAEQEILLNVNYGGIDEPASDITVTLQLMPELAAAYNAENFTDYPVLPANACRLEQTQTVIPAGKLRSQPVKLKINTIQIPGIATHIIPVGITNVSNGIKVNESLRIVYYLISGTYRDNPFPLFDRDWNITASSTNGTNVVARLLDNDSTTLWATPMGVAMPQELLVDLKSIKLIHGFVINSRRSTADPAMARDQGNPTVIDIRTSPDNLTWSEPESFTLTWKQSAASTGYDKPVETLYRGYAKTDQYVKIIIRESMGGLVAFSELNIF